MPGGADAQIGWVSEVTPGTAVTVTKFMPFVSESVKNNTDFLRTQTLSARRTSRYARVGTKSVSGGIAMELPNTTIATFLKHVFGTVGTSGAGPYTHTFTPADLTSDSLTVQIGRPATSGTVHPFTYAGMKVQTWEIGCNTGEIATLNANFIGMSETTATALATASYDATWAPFIFTEASLTIGGVAQTTVKSATIGGDNKIQLRHRLGSATSKEPLENGPRDFTGTIVTDFDSLTLYNLFVAGTQSALVLTFNNGTQSLVFTCNILFSGETPSVGGYDLLEQSLPYECISATSDAAAITAVLINSESSAA